MEKIPRIVVLSMINFDPPKITSEVTANKFSDKHFPIQVFDIDQRRFSYSH